MVTHTRTKIKRCWKCFSCSFSSTAFLHPKSQRDSVLVLQECACTALQCMVWLKKDHSHRCCFLPDESCTRVTSSSIHQVSRYCRGSFLCRLLLNSWNAAPLHHGLEWSYLVHLFVRQTVRVSDLTVSAINVPSARLHEIRTDRWLLSPITSKVSVQPK